MHFGIGRDKPSLTHHFLSNFRNEVWKSDGFTVILLWKGDTLDKPPEIKSKCSDMLKGLTCHWWACKPNKKEGLQLTHPFSARKARRPQIIVVLQSPVHGTTPTPRVLKDTYCWNSASFDVKASVTWCQNAGLRDWLEGHPPMAVL
jgi:hypothetical protein